MFLTEHLDLAHLASLLVHQSLAALLRQQSKQSILPAQSFLLMISIVRWVLYIQLTFSRQCRTWHHRDHMNSVQWLAVMLCLRLSSRHLPLDIRQIRSKVGDMVRLVFKQDACHLVVNEGRWLIRIVRLHQEVVLETSCHDTQHQVSSRLH